MSVFLDLKSLTDETSESDEEKPLKMNGTVEEYGQDNESDEEPDVEDLETSEICADNHTTCVSDNIDAVREVFDEETCLGMLVNYYQVYKEVELNESTTSCALSGCEFDYTSNTYRIYVELTAGSITIGEHFIVVKIDPCTGFPKICSIR